MGVVAKFRVNSIENKLPEVEYEREGETRRGPVRLGDDGEAIEAMATVKFSAVYPGDSDNLEEDTHFSKATPYGNLEMNVTNVAALEQFQVGDFYYLRFERA